MPEHAQREHKIKKLRRRYLFVCWHCFGCGRINTRYSEYETPPPHVKCGGSPPGALWEPLYRLGKKEVC